MFQNSTTKAESLSISVQSFLKGQEVWRSARSAHIPASSYCHTQSPQHRFTSLQVFHFLRFSRGSSLSKLIVTYTKSSPKNSSLPTSPPEFIHQEEHRQCCHVCAPDLVQISDSAVNLLREILSSQANSALGPLKYL